MDFRSLRQPQPNAFAQIMQQAQPGGQIAQQAQTPRKGISQEEMEAAAQARGYDSYEQMIDYQRRRIPPPRRPKAEGQSGNVLQDLWNDPLGTVKGAFGWHPAQTLSMTNEKLDEANRRNR